MKYSVIFTFYRHLYLKFSNIRWKSSPLCYQVVSIDYFLIRNSIKFPIFLNFFDKTLKSLKILYKLQIYLEPETISPSPMQKNLTEIKDGNDKCEYVTFAYLLQVELIPEKFKFYMTHCLSINVQNLSYLCSSLILCFHYLFPPTLVTPENPFRASGETKYGHDGVVI